MSDSEKREMVLADGGGKSALSSTRFNPRIARGLAWLNAEATSPLLSGQGSTGERLELVFPGTQKLGYFCPLTSIPDFELWMSSHERTTLRWKLWPKNHSLDSHALLGRITVSNTEPVMLALTDLDCSPTSDFEFLRQFASAKVKVIDAHGCAGRGLDGVWFGATGSVVRYLTDYKHLMALSLNLSGATDADLEPISTFSSLQYLDLTDTQITDAGLRNLRSLANLRHLYVGNDSISGVGLYNLTGLGRLEFLDLSMNSLSGKHLVHLRGLNRLTHLDLSYTNVADDSFRHLIELPHLRALCLQSTHVTLPGLRSFLRARPDIDITDLF